MQVMDNKLFSIEPRGGKLLPGESHTVTLTYRYVSEISKPQTSKNRPGKKEPLKSVRINIVN